MAYEEQGGGVMGELPKSRNLIASFSGGRTSAFMTWALKKNLPDHNLVVLFANTGQEDERTLEFVHECDQRWNLGVVWLECVVKHGEREGTGYKVVSFKTAARNGEPFEDVIKKYGIPNQAYPHCTREMKLAPINAYTADLMAQRGWTDRAMCVGIRADELHRMKTNFEADGLFYPLIQMLPTTKPAVQSWWRKQDFDLQVPEHYGNCVTCWKKSMRKLMTVADDDPGRFDFFARMERDHGLSGHNEDGTPRTFFRKHLSTQDILDAAKKPFARFVDTPIPYQDTIFDVIDGEEIPMDSQSDCEEECQPFGIGTKVA